MRSRQESANPYSTHWSAAPAPSVSFASASEARTLQASVTGTERQRAGFRPPRFETCRQIPAVLHVHAVKSRRSARHCKLRERRHRPAPSPPCLAACPAPHFNDRGLWPPVDLRSAWVMPHRATVGLARPTTALHRPSRLGRFLPNPISSLVFSPSHRLSA